MSNAQRIGFRAKAALLAILPLAALAAGCKDDPTGISTDQKTQILTAVATSVILPTLNNFKTTSAALATATVGFSAAPSGATLTATQDAWRAARAPWESSEAFGFGPAETGGFDGASDSWPVNLVDLNAVLADNTPIDQAYITALGEDVKGFHAIEYVLFGQSGTKAFGQFTARELEYLVAATANLASQGVGLAAAWDLTTGYGHELATAGSGSVAYSTQKDALQELVQGMADVADEVATSKIPGPLGPPVNPELLESRFSNNTGPDLVNDLQGIANVYNGIGGSKAIKTLVAALDASADQQVTAALQAATAALAPLTANFETSLSANPAGVQAAITAFANLQTVLLTKVLPLVNQ